MLLIDIFCGRIIKDLCHKELLPLKFLFFVKTSTLYVLYPYLTIHMRELGINVEETAIMSAITPFVAIIMPPLAGLVADRIGNFKLLMAILSAIGGLAALLLLLVPVGRVTVKHPERLILDLSCDDKSGGLIYSINNEQYCMNQINETLNLKLETCGYSCYVNITDNNTAEAITMSEMYTMNVQDLSSNHNFSYGYAIPDYALIKKPTKEDIMQFREIKNNEFYNISIRRLSKNHFFFPSNQLDFFCEEYNFLRENDNIANQNLTQCNFDTSNMIFSNSSTKVARSFKSSVLPIRLMKDSAEQKLSYIVDSMQWNKEFKSARCNNFKDNIKVDFTVPLIRDKSSSSDYNQSLKLSDCSKTCILSAPRSQICTNPQKIVEYNTKLTFWLYLIIRVFLGIIGGTAFAMFEGAVIAILREQKADYGMQRIYGSIGGMISSPLSGLMIDYASQDKEYTDFRPAFYLYAALKIISGALIMMINLDFKVPAHNVVSDVLSVLKDIEIVALLVTCFILGIAWGYIESFLFWFLQDLGGSRSLMGITVTVGGIAGLPLLVLSGPIINKFGHANVIFIGFIFYAIRLIGYSLIYNPWHALFFEALESITSSLSFTAAVTYAAKLSTTSIDSSIQGLLGGLYYGVGKGFGSLAGGYLMQAYGTRPTYRMYAAMTLIAGIIYFIFNMTYLRKRHKKQNVEKEAKNEKDSKIENGKIDIDKIKTKENEVYILNNTEKMNVVSPNDFKKSNNCNTDEVEKSLNSAKTANENKTEISNKNFELNGISNPALENDDSPQNLSKEESCKIQKDES